MDAVAARAGATASAEHELIAEVASALLFSRLFVTGEPLDDAFLDRLADAVILPSFRPRQPAARSGPPEWRTP